MSPYRPTTADPVPRRPKRPKKPAPARGRMSATLVAWSSVFEARHRHLLVRGRATSRIPPSSAVTSPPVAATSVSSPNSAGAVALVQVRTRRLPEGAVLRVADDANHLPRLPLAPRRATPDRILSGPRLPRQRLVDDAQPAPGGRRPGRRARDRGRSGGPSSRNTRAPRCDIDLVALPFGRRGRALGRRFRRPISKVSGRCDVTAAEVTPEASARAPEGADRNSRFSPGCRRAGAARKVAFTTPCVRKPGRSRSRGGASQ